jgi:general secretion pathway protein B
MSFILDALKKSESDRQRQSGPALFEVKVAPPRSRAPLWAMAIAALLGVNLVIVAWVLLRHPAQTPAGMSVVPAASAVVTSVPTATVPPASAALGQAQPGPTAQVANAVAPAGAAQMSPMAPMQGSAQPAPMSPAGASPLSGAPHLANTNIANGATDSMAVPKDPAFERSNPDDYEPAAEPGSATPFGGRVRRGTESGLPLYQDAALAPGSGIPQLRLDLHVFASKPQERFVMINMHKLHEGDTLPDGVRVESITPDGAVLSRNGSRFLLPRD